MHRKPKPRASATQLQAARSFPAQRGPGIKIQGQRGATVGFRGLTMATFVVEMGEFIVFLSG